MFLILILILKRSKHVCLCVCVSSSRKNEAIATRTLEFLSRTLVLETGINWSKHMSIEELQLNAYLSLQLKICGVFAYYSQIMEDGRLTFSILMNLWMSLKKSSHEDMLSVVCWKMCWFQNKYVGLHKVEDSFLLSSIINFLSNKGTWRLECYKLSALILN